jgi:hypothetical protein
MDTVDVRHLPGTEVVTVTEGEGFFPVVTVLGERELLAVLRGGAGHIGIKGRLDVVRSADGGRTWSPPVIVADSERDDRNPALGVASDGTIIVAYHWQGSYTPEGKWDPASNRVDTRIVRSYDGGRTWTDDELLGYTRINSASPFGKIRNINDTLFMPIYTGPTIGNTEKAVKVDPPTCPTYLLRSTDNGRTWGDPILVALGLNEADLLPLPSGEWLFAARSEKGGAIYILHSSDTGQTWHLTGQPTAVSEHPPDLTLLGNGWILLVFGHRHPPFGVQGIVSKDGGHTWEPRRLIFEDHLFGSDIGYPSTARLSNGRLITLFYSAGSAETPHAPYEMIDVLCRAVWYNEEAIIDALA